MKNINEILLRRRNKIMCDMQMLEEEDNKDYVVSMMKNVQELGYTFDDSLIEYLRRVSKHDLVEFYTELICKLKEYVGADKKYNFFYKNFPDEVISMSDAELFINAIVAYATDSKILIREDEMERFPLVESVELKKLSLGCNDDLKEILDNLIGTKTSLSAKDVKDLEVLFSELSDAKSMPEIAFKENLPIIANIVISNTDKENWFDLLSNSFKTATDVLRLVVRLNNGDVSLAEKTNFKTMPRSQRKLIISLLNNCGNIEEDMLRYKSEWIRVGEILHVGEKSYRKFEKVQKAFYKLRNTNDIKSFASKLNSAFVEDTTYSSVVKLLKQRPGEFARNLDRVLRTYGSNWERNDILNEFCEVASNVSIPVLLQLREHFMSRALQNSHRSFVLKSTSSTKVYVKKDELKPFDIDLCKRVWNICEYAIKAQLRSTEKEAFKGKKFYISDEMKKYAIPKSQRNANSAMRNISRGSRMPINDNAKFIRLGVHWMNEMNDGRERRTDIDLSCSFLDENLTKKDRISYTHLRNKYSTHSGDLTDAPRSKGGASECVDINLNDVPSDVRYAVIQVFGYTNTPFNKLDDMIFTWQEGVEPQFGDIFEPSRTKQCFNLGGNTLCEIPIIIDLHKREVIWCDLTLNTVGNFSSNRPNNVEINTFGVSAMVLSMLQTRRPSMYSLAILNAGAYGTIVTDRNEADVIFDLDETKPIVTIEKYIEVQDVEGNVIDSRVETESKEKDCRIITPFMLDVWMGEML